MAYQKNKDVTPFVGSDEEVDIVLAFTDGHNEPRRINIRRSIEGDSEFTGNATGYETSSQDLKDFMDACTRVPMISPSVTWDTETDISSGLPVPSRFKGSNGFQFCYQAVYNDGFVSAISPLSDVEYPTALFGIGVNSVSVIDLENAADINIPEIGNEAIRVRILFREGNGGVLKIIDEVSLKVNQSIEEWDLETLTYRFRNDKTYGVLSTATLNKNFDSVPQKAGTQSVVGERMMYGDYTENFDQVQPVSRSTVIFNEKRENLVGGEIELGMDQTLGEYARGATPETGTTNIGKQVHSTFHLNFSNLPEETGEAGLYDIRVNVRPKRNLHFFSSQSYYPTGFGYFNGSAGTPWPFMDSQGNINNAQASNFFSEFGGTTPNAVGHLSTFAPQSNDLSGNGAGVPYIGDKDNAFGHFNSKTKLNNIAQVGHINRAEGDSAWQAKIGSSPANPVIVQSRLISFRIAFRTTVELPRDSFMALFDQIVSTGSYDGSIVNLSEDDVEIFDSPAIETGEAVVDLIVDLGLDSRDGFDADSDLADLVCGIGGSEGGASPNGELGGWTTTFGGFGNHPIAYYIINRAKYSLKISKVQGTQSSSDDPLFGSGGSSPYSDSLFYKFKLKSFDFPSGADFDSGLFSGSKPDGYYKSALFDNILTCIPSPKEGLGLQTISAQMSGNGKDMISFPSQGSWTQGDSFEWRKGEVYFNGFADEEGNLDPDTVDWQPNDEWETLSNWSYYSTPLMPFCVGRAENGSFTYRWPVAKTVSGNNVPNSNIAHPASNGLGVKKSDGTYVSYQTYTDTSVTDTLEDNSGTPREQLGILNNGRVQGGDGPTAIGKWYVYSGNDALYGAWKDDFEFSADVVIKNSNGQHGTIEGRLNDKNNFSGSYTFRPSHPVHWLPYPYEVTAAEQENTGSLELRGYGFAWLTKFETLAIRENALDDDGTYSFSVIDGDAGPGGRSQASYSSEVVRSYSPGDEFGGEATGESLPVSNRRGSVWNTTMIGVVDNLPYLNIDKTFMLPSDDEFENSDLSAGGFEDVGNIISIITDSGDIDYSFKTNDVHNFGIVYYDNKGRASSVFPIDSAFVPGYSDSERSSIQNYSQEGQANGRGSVDVEIELFHPMPTWAESWRIVYGGASSTRRFTQMVSGGAFVEKGSNGNQDDSIYVSMNYLQGSKISYTKAFGARDQDTLEPTLYRFSEGDKVRVISSFSDDENVAYHPRTFVFDVMGTKEISSEEDNPLVGGEDDFDAKIKRTGSFLILRNNINAHGFDAASVLNQVDKWGNRCVFEIVTEKSDLDEDLLPYFETSARGIKSGLNHQPDKIRVTKGDVFFRAVPQNAREYNAATSQFVDLIEGDNTTEEDKSKSRFRGFFMESNSVTDLYRSQSKSYGRIHYVNRDSGETRNEASIIFGEKNSSETFRPSIFSFPSSANFYDLPKRYGKIDYMAEVGNRLVAIQDSKVSDLFVNKSITSTADGVENLALSSRVLQNHQSYANDFGTSGHPESVTIVDNDVYFADTDNRVVVRVSGKSIEEISNNKMRSFFRDFLKTPEDSGSFKVVTGYNPVNRELIISRGSSMSTNLGSNLSQFTDTYWNLDSANHNTVAFNAAGDPYWKTFYSFDSLDYSFVNESFLSSKNQIDGDSFFYEHNKNDLPNRFHGYDFVSHFRSVFNDNGATVHAYKSSFIEGDEQWSLKFETDNEKASLTSFTEKEGTFYSDLPRSELGGSSNIKSVGLLSSMTLTQQSSPGELVPLTFLLSNSSEYTFNVGESVDISVGIENQITSMSSLPNVEVVFVKSIKENIIEASIQYSEGFIAADFFDDINGKDVIIVSDPNYYGDQLRDKYLIVDAAIPKTNGALLSIGVDSMPSNLDSSM